ncbi:MAG: glutathione S-transferase family protein [Solirubrobacteraceae bacterium]|nr:glutathione S-transferase family protein [Solirubrobacteraceae bacterium]
MADLRVHRIVGSPYAGRVALAAAHKHLTVAWVDVDPDDRRAVRRLSGQDRVPVAEAPDGGPPLVGSMAILRALDDHWPTRPLWPTDPGDAALADLFARRFDDVWHGPAQRLAELLAPVGHDRDALPDRWRRAVDDDAARLQRWNDRLEERLLDADHLGGPTFGICDVVAHPFLRHGALGPDGAPGALPIVLHRHGTIDRAAHPRLHAWVRRVEDLHAA